MLQKLIFYSNYYNIYHMNIQNSYQVNWMQINHENQFDSEQLESMKLSQVFCQVKGLVNSIFTRRILSQNAQQSRKKLKLIYEFVVKKLKSRMLLDIKKFVGLMSLLSFILVSTKGQTNSLNFPNHFYRNIIKYTQKIALTCLKKEGPETDEQKRKILSAYLFSLCTFCEGGEKIVGFNMKKLFSLSLIKTILKLRLTDDQRIMRHYRIIILYITDNKPKLLSNSLLFQSLTYHFTECCSNKGTQSIIIFLLNRLLRNQKLAKKLTISFNLSNVIKKIKEVMSRETTILHLHRLSFSLLSKIIEADNTLSQNLMNANEIITVISQFYTQINNNKKINSSIRTILNKMSFQDSFIVYKAYADFNKFNSNSLRIIQILTQKPNHQIIFDMINEGFILALTRYSRSPNASQYHQYLVARIMENILIISQDINKQIGQILKELIFSIR